MKALVQTKNKVLHSFGDTKTSDDTEYLSVSRSCLSMLSQQKKVYKNLVKQEQNGMKHISFGPLCTQLRRGCERDEMFYKYESCQHAVDQLLLVHEGKAQDSLNAIASYLRTKRIIKEQIKQRGNTLVEYDLAQNDLAKVQAKGESHKLYAAQQKFDNKKIAFEACHSNLCVEMGRLMDNKHENFDIHVAKILALHKALFAAIRDCYITGGMASCVYSVPLYSSDVSTTHSISSPGYASATHSNQSFSSPVTSPSHYPLTHENSQPIYSPESQPAYPPASHYPLTHENSQHIYATPSHYPLTHENSQPIYSPESHQYQQNNAYPYPPEDNNAQYQGEYQNNVYASPHQDEQSNAYQHNPEQSTAYSQENGQTVQTNTENNITESDPRRHIFMHPQLSQHQLLSPPPHPLSPPPASAPVSPPSDSSLPVSPPALPNKPSKSFLASPPSSSPYPTTPSHHASVPAPTDSSPPPVPPKVRSSVLLSQSPVSPSTEPSSLTFTSPPTTSPRSSVTLPSPPATSPRSSVTLPSPPARTSLTLPSPPQNTTPPPVRRPPPSSTPPPSTPPPSSPPSYESPRAHTPPLTDNSPLPLPTHPVVSEALPVYNSYAPDTIPSPSPASYVPDQSKSVAPATEDISVKIWREVIIAFLNGTLSETYSTRFSPNLQKSFPLERCQEFVGNCVYHGTPVRYETCSPTKEGYIGVKMVIKDLYLVEMHCIVNLMLTSNNQITAIYTDGVKSSYVPALELPPMMALGIQTTTRRMKATLSLSVVPSYECIVLFGAPPTIPGHQECGELTVHCSAQPFTITQDNTSMNVGHWTLLQPSPEPVEIVAEYSWIYKQRALVATSPEHTPLFQPLSPQEYLDENNLRRHPHESEITFCYRVMQHLAKAYYYDAGPGARNLGDKGLGEGCRLPGTDCGGHARLFVGIARANGIPARMLSGQWADSNQSEKSYSGKGLTQDDREKQIHVRAEFFAQDVGWVPVEATEKDEPLKQFGNDPHKPFITKSINDMSLKLPYAQNSKTFNFCGKVQTYTVLDLYAPVPAAHTFLKWHVESCPI